MPDIHSATDAPTAEEIVLMEPRMMAFIFPNTPTTAAEKAAFDKAVIFQICHEKSAIAALQGQSIPSGVTGFRIGDFQMSFNGSGTDAGRLTKQTICPSAYGLLLREGLLYRGVEGRC